LGALETGTEPVGEAEITGTLLPEDPEEIPPPWDEMSVLDAGTETTDEAVTDFAYTI
jgi:hypothetical protein